MWKDYAYELEQIALAEAKLIYEVPTTVLFERIYLIERDILLYGASYYRVIQLGINKEQKQWSIIGIDGVLELKKFASYMREIQSAELRQKQRVP